MPVTVNCPGHGGPLQLPDNIAGKKVRCPKCQIVFEVPAAAAPNPESPVVPSMEIEPTPAPVEATAVQASPPRMVESAVEKPAKERPKPPPITTTREEAATPRRRLAQQGSAFGVLGIVLGVGGVLALGACCIGTAGLGWFLFRVPADGPQPMVHDDPPAVVVNDPPGIKKPFDPLEKKEKEPVFKEEPPIAVKLVDGVFETSTTMNPFERDRQNFTRRKRFQFTAKADTAYWVEAREIFPVDLRVEPLDGGPAWEPKDQGARFHLAFFAEKAGDFIVVAACHQADANRPFKLAIREVNDDRPLPNNLKLAPANPPALPKVEIALNIPNKLLCSGAFAPDNKSFWTSNHDMTLTLWSHPNFEIRGTYQMTKRLYSLGVDSKGRLYAQKGPPDNTPPSIARRTVEDIEVYEGLAPQGDKNPLPAPTKMIPLRGLIKRFIPSPDGRWLYLLDTHNRKVCRIDTDKAAIDQEVADISTSTTSFCLTPDGKKIYCCSQTNRIDVIDTATFKLERAVTINKGQPTDIAATDQGMVILIGERTEPFGSGNCMFLDMTKKIDERMKVIPLNYHLHCTHLQLARDQKAVFLSGDRRVGISSIPARPELFPNVTQEVWIRDFFMPGWIQLSPDGRTMLHDVGAILSVSR